MTFTPHSETHLLTTKSNFTLKSVEKKKKEKEKKKKKKKKKQL